MRRFASLALLIAACSTTAADSESGTATLASSGGSASSTGGAIETDPGAPTTSAGQSSSDTTLGGETSSGTSGESFEDYGMAGAAPVGNATFVIVAGARSLPVEVWYPADAAAQAMAEVGHPIEEFVAPGPDREMMEGLLANLSQLGEIGVRRQTRSARDAASSGAASYPLIVFSHCHNCVRFSMFSLAEHLASRGFVVVAPDHVDNTLFAPRPDFDEPFLEIRLADQIAVLDAVLDADHQAVPEAIRGKIDPSRVGAMGHSFGAATVGRLAQDDDRIVAVLPIAAPVESPFFPKTQVTQIAEPTLYVLAVEDNSITQLGNNLIGMNFEGGNTPSYLVRIGDTGHWGPTDICGLVTAFDAGCGPGTRMTDGTDFEYLEPAVTRAIVAGYAAAFFDLHLLGNEAALAYLQTAEPAGVVEVEARL